MSSKGKQVVEEGEIIDGDFMILSDHQMTMESPPSHHSSSSTSRSGCSNRNLQLGDGKVIQDCGQTGKIFRKEIKFFDFLGNWNNNETKEIGIKETETETVSHESSQISTELTLFDKSWAWPVGMGNSGFILKRKKDQESDITAQKLKKFRTYTEEEEEMERVSGVSTKLKLYEDPWKIKKELLPWDDCRLSFKKKGFEAYILPLIQIDEKKLEDKGIVYKVWDYDTKTEHLLNLKKLDFTYVFTDWKNEFVDRRLLKTRDMIGMFWNPIEERFWFRALAKEFGDQETMSSKGKEVEEGELNENKETETETVSHESSHISMELTLFDKSWPWPVGRGNRAFIFKCKKDQESDITAQKLKKFRTYTEEEEEIERVSGVSTKLKQYEDPWKIKKELLSCDESRLLFGKKGFEEYILPLIQIDEKKLESKGRVYKVWDYDTETEHFLMLKKLTATYIFSYWKNEFVNRRSLKRGDKIGMFWNAIEKRFWFRVLAKEFGDRETMSCKGKEAEVGETIGGKLRIVSDKQMIEASMKYPPSHHSSSIASGSGSLKRKLQLGDGEVGQSSGQTGKIVGMKETETETMPVGLGNSSNILKCNKDQESDTTAQKFKKIRTYMDEGEETEEGFWSFDKVEAV